MQKKLIAMSTLLTVVAFVSTAQAEWPHYVDLKPIEEVIKQSPQPLKSGSNEAGTITWGADYVDYYANGISDTTQPGSILGEKGQKWTLVHDDNVYTQARRVLSGEQEIFRGTAAMANYVAPLFTGNARLRCIYNKSRSVGGDVLIVKPDAQGNRITKLKDLKGVRIVMQGPGPHMGAHAQVLDLAGLTPEDVETKYVPDLTESDKDPLAAFRKDPKARAAWVIWPDAIAATEGEEAIQGAEILFHTGQLDQAIFDQQWVREDYFQAHKDELQEYVHGLMLAEQKVRDLLWKNSDSPEAVKLLKHVSNSIYKIADPTKKELADLVLGTYQGSQTSTFAENVNFFGNPNNDNNFDKVNARIMKYFVAAGLVSHSVKLDHAKWDFDKMRAGITGANKIKVPKFDQKKVRAFIAKKRDEGKLDDVFVVDIPVYFPPEETDFPIEDYLPEFTEAIRQASRWGGASISVEGNSEQTAWVKLWIRKNLKGDTRITDKNLRDKRQEARNQSMGRAETVIERIIQLAREQGKPITRGRFVPYGHGIDNPIRGIHPKYNIPIPPKTEDEWKRSRRVDIRIMKTTVEATEFEEIDLDSLEIK